MDRRLTLRQKEGFLLFIPVDLTPSTNSRTCTSCVSVANPISYQLLGKTDRMGFTLGKTSLERTLLLILTASLTIKLTATS